MESKLLRQLIIFLIMLFGWTIFILLVTAK